MSPAGCNDFMLGLSKILQSYAHGTFVQRMRDTFTVGIEKIAEHVANAALLDELIELVWRN